MIFDFFSKKRADAAKRRKKLDVQNKCHLCYTIKAISEKVIISEDELVQVDWAEAFYRDGNKQAAYESAKVLLDKHNMPEFEVLLLTGYWPKNK